MSDNLEDQAVRVERALMVHGVRAGILGNGVSVLCGARLPAGQHNYTLVAAQITCPYCRWVAWREQEAEDQRVP